MVMKTSCSLREDETRVEAEEATVDDAMEYPEDEDVSADAEAEEVESIAAWMARILLCAAVSPIASGGAEVVVVVVRFLAGPSGLPGKAEELASSAVGLRSSQLRFMLLRPDRDVCDRLTDIVLLIEEGDGTSKRFWVSSSVEIQRMLTRSCDGSLAQRQSLRSL